MRWLTLYARSRGVPASLAAVVALAVAVWALGRSGGGGPGDLRLTALVLAAGVMAVAAGLGGQDLALDRTAAIRWVPRRAGHVLLGGVAVGAVLMLVGGERVSAAVVVRDGAGLMGLAALGAAWCGSRYAWLPPFGWLMVSFVVPPATTGANQVLTWMVSPPGTAVAAWTAVALALTGIAVYVVAGPRR
ncbi:hypothetical protein ACFVIM_27910 [Streptomyces sp. NPDC057638]|uniref:hypothetical protein n=1 Tax=Streptomyces sp. NPDC057638 TaxID=3346190 RepID=UPI003699F1B4